MMNLSSSPTATTGTHPASASAAARNPGVAAATKPPLLHITVAAGAAGAAGAESTRDLAKRPRHRHHHKDLSSPRSPGLKGSRGSKGSRSSTQELHPSPRIVLGAGAVGRLPNELGRLHVSSPLIVSSPSRVALAKKIQALIPNLSSRILDSALVQVPSRVIDDTITRIMGRDCVISVGGGSAVNLARAIASRKGIPHICIPTTYAGSELISQTSSGREHKKSSLGDSKTPPTVVIYDEDLTVSSPKRFSAPSAFLSMTPAHDSRSLAKDGGALWSYLHIPGV